MFGLGTTELLIILALAIVIFGGKKLPQLGKGLGEGIRNFKSAIKAIGEDPPVEMPKSEKQEKQEKQ
jgi:sec-independent protein translocase protein TatA